MKGADQNGKKRPLLGATRAVYDWLKDHPTGEDEDFLITCLPTANRGTPGAILSQSNIRTRLKIIAENAEVNKPPNSHNFRHYFVTTCKRDYNLDEATINHLIGHGPGSTMMETTYQHLTDDDHIKTAEVAAGLCEPDQESPLTPTACPTCGESTRINLEIMSRCGTVFAPNAADVQSDLDTEMKQSYGQTDPADDETLDKIDTLDTMLDDPDVKAALLERLTDDE